MNLEEACTFLKCNPDDLEDALENAVFEWKKNILQKPLLALTLKSKVQLLEKFKAISDLLEQSDVESFVDRKHPDYGKTVQEQFTRYAEQMAVFKIGFSNESNVNSLQKWLDYGLSIEQWNTNYYADYSDWCEEQPVFGKLSDEVAFLKALHEQAALNRNTIEALFSVKTELPIQLRLELKRLSLLHKYL